MVLIKYTVGQINETLTNMHNILYEIFCLLACKWSNVSMCSNMWYLLSYNLIVKLSITCPRQVWERLSLSDNNNTLFLYKRLMLSKPVIKIYTQFPHKGLHFYLTCTTNSMLTFVHVFRDRGPTLFSCMRWYLAWVWADLGAYCHWVLMHRCPAGSGKHFPCSYLPPLALTKWSLSLERRECGTDVPFMAKHPTASFSLHVHQWWISVLTAISWKDVFLVRVKRSTDLWI